MNKNIRKRLFVLVLTNGILGGCAQSAGPLASTEPIPPVSITTPSSLVFTSNNSQQDIIGDCVDGYDVVLSGDIVAGEVLNPVGQLSVACASSTFTFSIEKSVNGTYNIDVTQESGGESSSAVRIEWTYN